LDTGIVSVLKQNYGRHNMSWAVSYIIYFHSVDLYRITNSIWICK